MRGSYLSHYWIWNPNYRRNQLSDNNRWIFVGQHGYCTNYNDDQHLCNRLHGFLLMGVLLVLAIMHKLNKKLPTIRAELQAKNEAKHA